MDYPERNTVDLLVSDLLRNAVGETSNPHSSPQTSIPSAQASQSQSGEAGRNSVQERSTVRKDLL